VARRHFMDYLSLGAGCTFLLLAGFIFVRPGGLLHNGLIRWRMNRLVSAKWDSIAAVSPHFRLGGAGASHSLVEFIDYQCSYCRAFADTARTLLEVHRDIAIAVRQLPRPGDDRSRMAALAAICAGFQQRFAAMHHYLLSDTSWQRSQSPASMARAAGLADTATFMKCITSPEAAQLLALDSSWAVRFRLQETPVLMSRNSGLHRGLASVKEISSWLLPSNSKGTVE
jgi:protein-disulfide isomerase